jgi:hypothetical protein
MSITGLPGARKGCPDALKRVHVTAHAEDQSISHVPFMAAGKRSRCTADQTAIEPLDWQTLAAPERPRLDFGGPSYRGNRMALSPAYSSQITAGVAAAHYRTDDEDFAGITMATKRVYPRGPDGNANFDRLVLTIDSTDIGFL